SAYVESQPYELPDPLEKLVEALDKVGDLKDADWIELCDDVVEAVGWLLGGLDKRRVQLASSQVERWLKQVRSVNEKDFARKRADLEKTARLIVDQVPPTLVLTHI